MRKVSIYRMLGAASVVSVIAAQAQATQPPAARVQATTGVTTDQGTSGDIVVTANKREQSVSKVGLSITAISGDMLAERKITSVQDIAAAIPSLKYAESGTSTPIYTLRGVGFNEESLGVYPSVSVYVDEVPLPFPVLTLHTAYDLQRVEVLKGPQGTLFGENATGGAINYVAAKPTQEMRYGADIDYGRFNQIDGNAFLSGSLGGGFSGRIAFTGMHRDGWQNSLTRSNDRNGAVSYAAGRASLAYDGGGIRALASVNVWRDTSEPEAAQLIAVRPQRPADVHISVLNAPFAANNAYSSDWTPGNYRPSSNRKFVQGSLRLDADLGTFAKLTSLTSYVHFDQDLYSDKDGTAELVANLGPSLAKIHSFYQELRLANQGKSDLTWVLGVNVEKSKTHEDQSLAFGDGSSSNPSTLNIDSTGSQVDQDILNYAVFGNAQYEISSKLTLKAGGRYTDSRNKADLCGYANGDGNVATLFNVIAQYYTAKVPFTPITTGQCYVLNFQGVPGSHFYDTLHEHNFSWLAGLDYHFSQQGLFYANISRGYKAGSFPTLAGSTFQEYIPVRQESVTSYEAGIKTPLFDRNIRLTAAGFYYDYANKQVRGKIVDPIFNILDTLLNVPKSRIYGFEGEVNARVAHDLTVVGAVTYLKSNILSSKGQDFSGPNAYGLNANYTGNALPFTPSWSYSINTEYRHEMANSSAIFAGVDVHGQSSSVSTLGGGSITFAPLAARSITTTNLPFVIPAYATVDARIGYQLPGRNVSVMLWGKNILDKYYWTNANQYLDATVRFAGLPATYGITLSIKN